MRIQYRRERRPVLADWSLEVCAPLRSLYLSGTLRVLFPGWQLVQVEVPAVGDPQGFQSTQGVFFSSGKGQLSVSMCFAVSLVFAKACSRECLVLMSKANCSRGALVYIPPVSIHSWLSQTVQAVVTCRRVRSEMKVGLCSTDTHHLVSRVGRITAKYHNEEKYQAWSFKRKHQN